MIGGTTFTNSNSGAPAGMIGPKISNMCQRCDGSGYISDTAHPCFECDGSGTVNYIQVHTTWICNQCGETAEIYDPGITIVFCSNPDCTGTHQKMIQTKDNILSKSNNPIKAGLSQDPWNDKKQDQHDRKNVVSNWRCILCGETAETYDDRIFNVCCYTPSCISTNQMMEQIPNDEIKSQIKDGNITIKLKPQEQIRNENISDAKRIVDVIGIDTHGRKAHDPGAKLDSGKVLAGVLGDFSLALNAVAEIGTYGINKYSRGGWEHVPDAQTRYTDALWRHLLAESTEPIDQESGLLHQAHLAWNALAKLELMLRNKGE